MKRRTFDPTMFNGARILVAPLDWGLGHSTRCIPIIQRLLELDAVPVIGADRGPLAVLTGEFPHLEHVQLPGVNIRYGKGRNQLWSMARQFPAMLRSVQAERALFDRIRRDLRLDAVISDQRFGIRSSDLPSVIVTHQVFPFTPIAQAALRKVNLHQIARFDRCWIMDEPDAPGLAGDLSHGKTLPANARYIGTVSRMRPDGPRTERSFRVVAVISGPEPQRTLLEQLLTDQLQRLTGEHLLVQGLPANSGTEQLGNVTKVPHMNASELAAQLAASEFIVSRSGYTTLMDLVALDRTALVIPTPGQAEQEYLGELHARTGRFTVQRQHKMDLAAGLKHLDKGLVARPHHGHPLLEDALRDLASLLR
ncbi:MAG: glycosyltransferase [Flavobacteriales bacterium]